MPIRWIGVGYLTPTIVDWMLAQRRGAPVACGPLLSIIDPTDKGSITTAAQALNLTGAASALGEKVTRVAWQNRTGNSAKPAVGTDPWTGSGIPLVAHKTNVIIVTGTTTNWASYLGGITTFSDTLFAIQTPIHARLALEGSDTLLDWKGGSAPYATSGAEAAQRAAKA